MTDVNELEGLRRRTVGLYVAALTLIAGLSTAGFFLVDRSIETNREAAQVTETASMQRVYAERIAFNISRVAAAETETEKLEGLFTLDAALSAMRSAHAHTTADRHAMSPETRAAYFTPETGVYDQIVPFIAAADRIVQTMEDLPNQRQEVNERMAPLLRALDRAVKSRIGDAGRRVDRTQALHATLFALTLLALIAEGVFLFRPLARSQLEAVAEARAQGAALAAERQVTETQRRFVSLVSHEFRTPLAVISGNCRRAGRSFAAQDPEQHGTAVSQIGRSVGRLLQMIEGILYSAKLRDGKISIDPGPYDFAAQVREAVSQQAALAEAFDFRTDLPETLRIHADEKLIFQIMVNLLSNAVKYSGEARVIEVSMTREGDEDVALRVRDHGVGVPAGEVEKVFGTFFRASTSQGIAGTGLGLNLSRTLARMHGGELVMQSDLGKGTEMVLRLPLAGSEAAPAPETGPESLAPAA